MDTYQTNKPHRPRKAGPSFDKKKELRKKESNVELNASAKIKNPKVGSNYNNL